MIFNTIPLQGAYLLELEKKEDQRGFFGRFFCEQEFKNKGLLSNFSQINNSLTRKKGTLRGMHFQIGNDAEVKVVRCIKGSLYDVIIDLRPDSPTFKKWFGAELTSENRKMMYVPKGFAHGFISLLDETEALYLVSTPYAPQSERGLCFNDKAFSVSWPISPREISDKDKAWPLFSEDSHDIASLRGFL